MLTKVVKFTMHEGVAGAERAGQSLSLERERPKDRTRHTPHPQFYGDERPGCPGESGGIAHAAVAFACRGRQPQASPKHRQAGRADGDMETACPPLVLCLTKGFTETETVPC